MINPITNEFNARLADLYEDLCYIENFSRKYQKEKEKLQLLHKEVEKYCAKKLLVATIDTIKIIQQALVLNTKDDYGCINAAIYLWENAKNDTLSIRENRRAQNAIKQYVSLKDIVNMPTIFTAIDSAIAGV